MSRTRDQWLENTVGSTANFQQRAARIREIRDETESGAAVPQHLDELVRLLGAEEDDD